MSERYEITVEKRPDGDRFHVWDESGALVYTTDSLTKAQDWLDQRENEQK